MRPGVQVILQEGDFAGLKSVPHSCIWLLMFHGIRDGIQTHFLFQDGDDKRLLYDSHTYVEAVVEIESLIGLIFKLEAPRVHVNNLWHYRLSLR